MTSDWPAWAIEAVAISPPRQDWPEQAARIKASLLERLAPWQITDIEHIGSTSIPGLPAKPIIDLMASIAELAEADQIAATLAKSNWHYVPPELDGRPWRRFFVQVVDNRRHAHLHLMDPATPRWQQQLTFRNRLRENANLRQQYGTLKHELAEAHHGDREAYSKAKTAFVAQVIGETPQ